MSSHDVGFRFLFFPRFQTVRQCVYGPSRDDDDDEERKVDPDLPTATFTMMVYSPVKLKDQTTYEEGKLWPGGRMGLVKLFNPARWN